MKSWRRTNSENRNITKFMCDNFDRSFFPLRNKLENFLLVLLTILISVRLKRLLEVEQETQVYFPHAS